MSEVKTCKTCLWWVTSPWQPLETEGDFRMCDVLIRAQGIKTIVAVDTIASYVISFTGPSWTCPLWRQARNA